MIPRTLFLLSSLVVAGVAAAAPPPGHPSVDQAQQIMRVPADQRLPHKGRVVQAIDSNDYTYIEVAVANGQHRWLAAPRTALKVNDWIRYGDGVTMKNFYSRKHHRSFEEVLFVQQVVALAPGA